ncbi:hypothetical protein DRP98_09695 [candidate division KSB1 bacterium]|nr:MAG: hypothetical protein DRP98_09695 [candidate division KSB1 bacterium]
MPNKALHLTAMPLRFIAAGELSRYETKQREQFMSALAWLGIIIAGVIILIIAYYAFFLIAKITITLLPAIILVLIGGLIGYSIGGLFGGVIFFISIVFAFWGHDKWESSDLYQKMEKWFDRNTSI